MDEWSVFKDANIEVHGKTFKILEFFGNPETVDRLQEIFCRNVPHFGQMTYILAKDTIPPEPTFYLTRLLSNRIKLDKAIFKKPWPDVFVFKNSIEQNKLSKITKLDSMVLSGSQLENLTSRFIYLDVNENWNNLKTLATATPLPIHLINYEADQNIFLLEDTSAPSQIRSKFGSQKERIYMSEDEFLEQQISEHFSASSVCICDTPGMGKTFLLANIARLMTKNYTQRIVVFMPMPLFSAKFSRQSPSHNSYHTSALNTVLEYTSQNPNLLRELIQQKFLVLEIFFDGFDEVPSDQFELMNQVLLSIRKKLPQVRIYITSRPHMRQQLENNLDVIAYDILPFDKPKQVEFLTQIWSVKENSRDYGSLQLLATSFLEDVNKSLAKNEKDIAGNPLLCQLIADVYVKDEASSTPKRRKVEVCLNLSKMYETIIKQKINIVAKNPEEGDYIRLVHIWHALKLHPSLDYFHKQLNNITYLTICDQLKTIGIMQAQSNDTLAFMHRTFAEYFVAEYFFKNLRDEYRDSSAKLMFEFLLKNRRTTRNPESEDDFDYHFQHPEVALFFNSAINKHDIPENLKKNAKRYVNFILPENEFHQILCACCQQEAGNIFFLLKEALKEVGGDRIKECFTSEYACELLTVCIRHPTSQLFNSCIQFFTEVGNVDIEKVAELNEKKVLKLAVECLNYEALKYFLEGFPSIMGGISALKMLVKNSYGSNSDIEEKAKILNLLLNKDPGLIKETDHILACKSIHLRLIKILIQFNANLMAVNGANTKKNCAMQAAKYMCPEDYHEFVEYLLKYSEADYLFRNNEKWTDPLPKIVKWAVLLPKTLDLLLKVPGITINMKNENGNNLAFLAVKGNKLDTLKHLVFKGLDINERGTHDRSLLHAAANWGDEEMVRYLLSKKLDVNSPTEIKETPLHYAVSNKNGLSIVKILVEKGKANVQVKNAYDQTPLHAFVIYSNSKESNVKIIKYLFNKGLKGVNDSDKDGNTPLHLCRHDKKVKKCLVDLGAKKDAENKEKKTPAQKNPGLWQ